jgi:endonuclease G
MQGLKVWRQALAIMSALLSACGGGDTPQEAAPYASDWVITLDHGGFVLRYDCTLHSALRFEYALQRDTGNLPRPSTYSADPALPSICGGQSSTTSYSSVHAGYDRGHLVPSNAMDANAQNLQSANFMSNIVPQVSSLNQGLWEATDNVAECYRDIAPLRVYGGVVFSDSSNDYFVSSHGLPTPDYFWKAIVTTDPISGAARAIAWYFPNQASLGSVDNYLVSIHELERLVGSAMVAIPVNSALKEGKPNTTWALPASCNLS